MILTGYVLQYFHWEPLLITEWLPIQSWSINLLSLAEKAALFTQPLRSDGGFKSPGGSASSPFLLSVSAPSLTALHIANWSGLPLASLVLVWPSTFVWDSPVIRGAPRLEHVDPPEAHG